MRKVVIIGGGLAGLISSIQLIRAGIPCTVIEKKSYPLHRVCGEYISNEALPFLKASGLYPKEFNLPQIKSFEFSSVSGTSSRLLLDLGGFGISRYRFDNHLFEIARKEGVSFQLNTEVSAIHFEDERFEIKYAVGQVSADVVIGSFGKRSKIDVQMNRAFIKKRSPYVGVKYHIKSNHPPDLISLHNFSGGYCGVCNVEEGITNLCYLSHRDNLRHFSDIKEMEKEVLFRNRLIKNIFTESVFIFQKPEVINEISFATKRPVEDHILMAGDAAGMITPVCGNGMAIAIHSGKIVSELVTEFCQYKIEREVLEERYTRAWNSNFKTRLWYGRNIQHLFGNTMFSTMAVAFSRTMRPLASLVVKQTHGKRF